MLELVSYGGWPNCLRFTHGPLEGIATTDVGPRILRFGFAGGRNEFREEPAHLGLTGGDEWRIYGGHRLWHAPEARPRSYQPDNAPVRWRELLDGVELIQPVEPATGIGKRIWIHRHDDAVVVTHLLTNHSLWPVRLSPWALTVMAPGGVAVLPQPRAETPDNLLPNRSIVLWPYTRPDDPRLLWGERFLRLRPDPAMPNPVKIGTQSTEQWCAYLNDGHLFLKRVRHFLADSARAEYPDLGCGLETYAAGDFLELETLGPLQELAPGQTAVHQEEWRLYTDADAATEEAVVRTVLPHVERILAAEPSGPLPQPVPEQP